MNNAILLFLQFCQRSQTTPHVFTAFWRGVIFLSQAAQSSTKWHGDPCHRTSQQWAKNWY